MGVGLFSMESATLDHHACFSKREQQKQTNKIPFSLYTIVALIYDQGKDPSKETKGSTRSNLSAVGRDLVPSLVTYVTLSGGSYIHRHSSSPICLEREGTARQWFTTCILLPHH